jgi:transcriptional regulator with XRE-family HTH domain
VGTSNKLFWELDSRRRELGISYSALSVRSGVSQPVVQRLLTGKVQAPRFPTVVAIAQSLGLAGLRILDDGSVKFDSASGANDLREQQARTKATRLVRMVQGTSALEGQAVSDEAYQAMVERTYHELLAGSDRRLWSS